MDEDEKRAFHCTVPILHNPPPIPSNKRIKKRVTSLDDFSRICDRGIDWSESFASIKRIRSQGLTFGSCWAFATIAAVEALHALTFQLQNPPILLSVQQLIDYNVANHGCGGGNVLDAFTYIILNEGLNTEQNYLYHGIQRTCDTVKEKGDGLEIDAYTIVNPRNKDQLAYALCEQPVVVGINAHGSNFSQYRGGIYRSECGTDISHSVSLVGMRIDKATNDQYWILKNSWGEKWGEGGFMKLLKNDGTPGGHCGTPRTSI
ncbi:zingipain-2-like [Prunus avium]|uniref:Zingipain-2-like n=1 Tax=Prunus avium TaxID=42229 RepID=A0A6P5RGU6_PRUAV|nr:zingipain-2-like [Prunus avium]